MSFNRKVGQDTLKPKKFKGFTLVELIVVIAIVALISVIAFAAIRGLVSSARVSVAVANANMLVAHANLELSFGGSAVDAAGIQSAFGISAGDTDGTLVEWSFSLLDDAEAAISLPNNVVNGLLGSGIEGVSIQRDSPFWVVVKP